MASKGGNGAASASESGKHTRRKQQQHRGMASGA